MWKDVFKAIYSSIHLQVCLLGTFLVRNASLISSTYI